MEQGVPAADSVPPVDACARDRHFLRHGSLSSGGASCEQRREEIATIEASPSSESASEPHTSLGHFSQVDQDASSSESSGVAMRMSSELVRKSIMRHGRSYIFRRRDVGGAVAMSSGDSQA